MEVLAWHLGWEPQDSSVLVLISLAILSALLAALVKLGVLRWAFRVVGVAVRGGVRAGFLLWKRLFSWADWPRFFVIVVVLLGLGVAAGLEWPWLAVLSGGTLLFMGVTTCLAYMFIDLERYEVGRGYKAMHNPLKGQALAVNLIRYGPVVGVPLLAGAAAAAIGGFAMLNQGLYHTIGQNWYSLGAEEGPTYLDFLAYPLVHLFRIVDLMDMASDKNYLNTAYVHPVEWPAKAMLTAFKAFFTLVLLQQLFASLRRGKLLSETIAEFWSPHEPIAERAAYRCRSTASARSAPCWRRCERLSFSPKNNANKSPRFWRTSGRPRCRS